jgi:hypothetical protein
VDERQKGGTALLEVFGHAPPHARDADCQQEAVARLGHERGGITENRNFKSVITKHAWVGGEKTGDRGGLIRPRIAGPVEHFPPETPGANDQNPSHPSYPRVGPLGSQDRVHSVSLGSFSDAKDPAAQVASIVYSSQARFLPGRRFADESWLPAQLPDMRAFATATHAGVDLAATQGFGRAVEPPSRD